MTAFHCLFLLCWHSQPLNGGSLLKHCHIVLDTLAVAVKAHLHLRRVAVGLPKSAAGKIPSPVFDEPDHVPEGIAQEDPDLMGELRLSLQAVGQLYKQAAQVRPCISGVLQENPTRGVCQQLLQVTAPVYIDNSKQK